MLTRKKHFVYSQGSITVEASLVLPIFIYGIVAFLYFLQVLLIQEKIQSAITQVGELASQYAFLYEHVKNYEDTGNQTEENYWTEEKVISEDLGASGFYGTPEKYIDINDLGASAFFQMKMRDYMDENLINLSCVAGGMGGISLLNSKFLEQNDMIEVTALYQIKIPVPIFKLKNIPVVQSVKLRAFTGYKPINYLEGREGNNTGEDKIVYITRTGTVYHLRRDCTYLKFNISSCVQNDIKIKRNENGGKYYECESCIGNRKLNPNDTVYITSDGTRYHSTLSCSKLKRSVIEILLSKVKERAPCSRCGGKKNEYN